MGNELETKQKKIGSWPVGTRLRLLGDCSLGIHPVGSTIVATVSMKYLEGRRLIKKTSVFLNQTARGSLSPCKKPPQLLRLQSG